MRWCNVQTNDAICKPKRIWIFALIINCTIIMKTKFRFSRNVYAISADYDVTNISGTQPRKNMIMGNISGTWNHYFSLRIEVDWLTYALVDWTTIGSDNGLSSPRHPSSIGSRTGILLIRHPEKTFQINLDHNITFNDTSLKCRRHFVPGVSVFTDKLNFAFLNLTLHSCIFIFNSFQFPIL